MQAKAARVATASIHRGAAWSHSGGRKEEHPEHDRHDGDGLELEAHPAVVAETVAPASFTLLLGRGVPLRVGRSLGVSAEGPLP